MKNTIVSYTRKQIYVKYLQIPKELTLFNKLILLNFEWFLFFQNLAGSQQ